MRAKRIDGPPEERFWPKVAIGGPDDCWLWTACRTHNGYGQFSLEAGRHIRAHRYSYFLAHGSFEENMLVLHRCDVRACVNPRHLFLGTARDNTQDMIGKGRSNKVFLPGSRNPSAKLTSADVTTIRERRASGARQIDIARDFGISKSRVSSIVLRKTWRLP